MADFVHSVVSSVRGSRTPKTKIKQEYSDPRAQYGAAPSVLPRLSTALRVALGAIIVGIVVIPLLYMPGVSAIGEWLRQTILFVVVAVAMVSVLVHMVRRKSLSVPRHYALFALLGGTAIIFFISALASKTPYVSLYGFSGTESYTATTFFALCLLTGVVVVVGQDRQKMYAAWLVGAGLVLVLSALSLFGLQVFPGAFPGYLPLGSALTTVMVAALSLVGAYGVLTEYRPPRAMYGISIVVALAALIILLSANIRHGWLVLGGGSLVFLIGAAIRKEEILSRAMLAPCIGLFLSIVYLFMAIPSIISMPNEVHLSLGESARVAREALKENPVLGSGPGTHVLEFLKYRKSEVLRRGFGEVAFHSGQGAVLTGAVTTGALGGLLIIATMVTALFIAGKGIIRERRTGSYLAIQSVLFTALVVSALLPIELPLMLTVAVFLGLSLAHLQYREISMARSEQGIAMRNAAVAAILLVVVVGTVIIVRRTGGVYFAVRAMQAYARDAGTSAGLLERALAFDRGHDGYWRMLSDARRFQVNIVRKQLGASAPAPEAVSVIQGLMRQMVDAANRAVDMAPGNASNWSTLGQAKLVVGMGNGALLDEAREAFERARALDPQNPAIITALGVTERLRSIQSANNEKPDNAKAVALLEEAINIQPAYALAHIELARLLASSNDQEKALSSYANARLAAPYDPTIAYEVAVYLREIKETKAAILEFERALQLAPNFVEAHVALVDLYTFIGENEKAIEHMEAVAKLFPENKDVQEKLATLKQKIVPAKNKK